MLKTYFIILFTLLLGTITTMAQDNTIVQDPGAPSGNDVQPQFFAGNPSCADVYGSGTWGLKVTSDYNRNVSFSCSGQSGVLCTGTDPLEDPGSLIILSSGDNVYFDWTLSSNCLRIIGVIVKGGPNADVYNYYPVNDLTGDTNLHAPINPNNDQPYGISHIEFCYEYDFTIECPADVTIECDESTHPDSIGRPYVPCELCPVEITYSDEGSLDECGLGTITRTWTVTDICGNTATCVQIITVVDTTPPLITCPPDLTFDCDSVNTGRATATDNCDPDPTVTFADIGSLDSCGMGTIYRAWTATDCYGNTASCVQTIIVQDTLPPLITCPPDLTFDCDSVNTGAATATDNCDPDPTVTFADIGSLDSCGMGTIYRAWTASDCYGNTASCVQTIIVQDTLPPLITCPPDLTFDCDSVNTGAATATDNCDPDPTVTFADIGSLDSCGMGTIYRAWTASDCYGNAATCVQTIIVQDTLPPVFKSCPADKAAFCDDSIVFDEPTVTDNCGYTLTYYTQDNRDVCGNGDITRTWTATDCAGNSSSCSQTITINDCSAFELIKTTDGEVDPAQDWSFTLTSTGGLNATRTTFGDVDGVLFDDLGLLSTRYIYTVCETGIPAGWTSTWTINGSIVFPTNPNAADLLADNSTLCYEFAMPVGIPPDCAFRIEVDNSYPGGAPRTPGYWKNWNSCSGGNQIATAEKNGGCKDGFCTLDDFLLELDFCVLEVKTCEEAVALLDAREIGTGKKKSSDAAYTLMRALLAARLNFAAGAETCPEAQDAAIEAEALLCSIGFDGTGSYLRPKDAEYQEALDLAAILDCYNNGQLCKGAGCSGYESAESVEDRKGKEKKAAIVIEETRIAVYPNPSSTGVNIQFEVPEDGHVTLDIFNLTGQKVNRIFDDRVVEGFRNKVRIEQGELSAGTYFYRLYDGSKVFQGKIIIME